MINLGKETETLEFKKTTGEMRAAMISIASILNKHGVGTLYFGVKPNGDATRDELAEKVSKTIRTVQRTLNSLRDKGYIEREGAKQNTVWKIRK